MQLNNPDKKFSYWGFRLVLAGVTACIPAFLSSFYSYKSTRVEAEFGYSAMVKSVTELQQAYVEVQKQRQEDRESLAYIKGRLEGIEKALDSIGRRVERGPASVKVEPPPPMLAPPRKFTKPPETFDKAVQMVQQKPLL